MNQQNIMQSVERKRLVSSLLVPFLIVAAMWLVKGVEIWTGLRLSFLGVVPLQWEGLPGILTAPLIHSDLEHLTSNSVPMFFLGAGLFYYYQKDALRILLLSYVLPGLWVWLFARGNSSHIGASGVVYALAAFHLFSGLIRREKKLLSFAMIVIFLYGSMIWGVFPDFFPNRNISWESHLMGGVAGLLLAIYFRYSGPQKQKKEWPEYDEEWEERIRMKHGMSHEEIEAYFKMKEEQMKK